MRKLLLLFALLCHLSLHAQNEEEMPIIAYIGVIEVYTSEENFRIFSECGFTVSLNPYSSLNALQKACRAAERYGVRVIGQCPEMVSDPRRAATALKQEKGFFGYLMQDEPSVPEIKERQKEIERLKRYDSSHVFYINLFPYQRKDWFESSTKAKTYPEYLKSLSETDCQQLSFDFYPVTTAGIRPMWYHNLEMVRQESLASGKPFWGFALSAPHEVPYTPDTYYPLPTMGSLRLQVYSNLAYGAQGIQYFTYWTPSSSRFHYHDAPVDKEGKKTKTYALVQQMNKELKAVSRLFYGAKVLSVHHLVDVPDGTTRLKTAPDNISSLRIIGRQGAIISQLEKDGSRFLAIVNKNHEGSMEVRIKPRNKVPCRLTKTLEEEPIKSSYKVEAGDLLLFKLK